MFFNSLHFILFFLSVVTIYFAIPYRFRWGLLLAASYYFYACWKVEYSVLIAISTIITYLTAIAISRSENKNRRKLFLTLSLVSNFAILFLFKYFNFINDSIRELFQYINISYAIPELKVLLPVGISFYTFQALSYSIDVYRKKKEPERHLGIYALYVSFFPQLVAGPIERSTNLLAQFYRKNDFNIDRVKEGIRQILWGFFKKIVIADRLAVIVDNIYNAPQEYNGVVLVIATLLFAYQIYCDFAGYSDIAIGTAKVLGYDLMTNFNRPYVARSISEFWQRWHISLSTWFRDYLYIPLGGNRVNKARWCYNIMIVFLVSGLWHGASWTFVVWGGLHGAYIVVSRITKNRQNLLELIKIKTNTKLYGLIQMAFTFFLVNIAWVFFRAKSISDAFYIIKQGYIDILGFIPHFYDGIYLHSILSQLGTTKEELILSLTLIILLEIVQKIQSSQKTVRWFFNRPVYFRWAAYYALTAIILFYGSFNSNQQFIYFQF